MFGLGMGEVIIILGAALIFIGPKKLPGLAKSLGKGLREFQKAKNDLMEDINTPDHHDHSEEHHDADIHHDMHHDNHHEENKGHDDVIEVSSCEYSEEVLENDPKDTKDK